MSRLEVVDLKAAGEESASTPEIDRNTLRRMANAIGMLPFDVQKHGIVRATDIQTDAQGNDVPASDVDLPILRPGLSDFILWPSAQYDAAKAAYARLRPGEMLFTFVSKTGGAGKRRPAYAVRDLLNGIARPVAKRGKARKWAIAIAVVLLGKRLLRG